VGRARLEFRRLHLGISTTPLSDLGHNSSTLLGITRELSVVLDAALAHAWRKEGGRVVEHPPAPGEKLKGREEAETFWKLVSKGADNAEESFSSLKISQLPKGLGGEEEPKSQCNSEPHTPSSLRM